MSPGRVTLLSDFGTADGYAAAMAGVIATLAPAAHIEHVSHDIPPGDIAAAALTLSRYAFLYPEGSVHLVVVDPGVGTDRRAIAAAAAGRYFVAPDNGVLTRVLRPYDEVTVVELGEQPVPVDSASATFHGRDLFAPAAGRLGRGERLHELGSPIDDPVLLAIPEPERQSGRAAGVVVQVDRFGNLITNIPEAWVDPGAEVRIGEVVVGPVRRTYGEVESGDVVALIGSLGTLEISVRDGSAAERLGAGRGTRVVLR